MDLSKGASQVTGEGSYRAGFLQAFFGKANEKDTLRNARRENVLGGASDIYHYTSLTGFQGIISSSGFWASDNRFLNDAEEMRHAAQLAAKVLQHCVKRTRIAKFAAILTSVRERMVAPPRRGNLVACFSTARDSLEQWRAYAPSGGVCINLSSQEPGTRPLFFGGDCLPYKVFYDARPKAVLLLSIIRRFEREYGCDHAAMYGNWPENHDSKYIEHLSIVLSGRIVGFKNESFRGEAEIRIVLPYDVEDRIEGGLRFRASPLGLIPYICLGDYKGLTGRLPIKEVIIGPSSRQELIAESVSTFLEHKNYSGVKVSLSRVPYRAS